MTDLTTDLAAALARIETRHARFIAAGRLDHIIARQRRELAAETTQPSGKA